MSSDPDDTGIGEDTPQGGDDGGALKGQGGEGREKEKATQPIGDSDQEDGQTRTGAPADETGGHEGGADRTD